MCVINTTVATLCVLLLCFGVACLIPRLLLHDGCIRCFVLLLVKAVIVVLYIGLFMECLIVVPCKMADSFATVHLSSVLSDLVVAIVYTADDLVPALVGR